MAPKPLIEVRQRVQDSLRTLRQDIKRNLNPTPYKVSILVQFQVPSSMAVPSPSRLLRSLLCVDKQMCQ